MPEGPEVRIHAEQLHKILVGKYLIEIGYDERSRYRNNPLTNIEKLEYPYEFKRVFSKGKKIVFELSNEIYLISSLGLEGHWQYEHEKHSNLWLSFSDDEDEVYTIYFDDSRHFGTLEIVLSKKDLDKRLSDIGPDILSEEVGYELFSKRIRKGNNKQICQVLMDQSYVSGIGNYLKSEILYKSKIRPDRLVKNISDDEMKILHENSIKLINSAYGSKGMTSATYRDVYGNEGSFKCVVYGCKKDPLGNDIVTSTFNDKRTTHWVKSVQN